MDTHRNLFGLAWSLVRQAQVLKKQGEIKLARKVAHRGLSIKALAWSLQPQPIPIKVRSPQAYPLRRR